MLITVPVNTIAKGTCLNKVIVNGETLTLDIVQVCRYYREVELSEEAKRVS